MSDKNLRAEWSTEHLKAGNQTSAVEFISLIAVKQNKNKSLTYQTVSLCQ